MIQHKSVKAKLSNSQLSKLKSEKKAAAEVTIKLSSNMIGNSNSETNFLHKLLQTDRHVIKPSSIFCK